MHAKLISIIIPCYNEEQSLYKLYDALFEVFNLLNKYNVEVYLINDGSTDNTFNIMKEIHNKDNRFKIISFSRNFGHQSALVAGLNYANGDAVISMDADLQDPPNIILEMIKKWESGYEVVYGSRKSRSGDSFFKRFTAILFYKLLSVIANTNIPENVGDFRLLDRKVVLALRLFKEKSIFLRGLVPYIGFKQCFVEFDRPSSIRDKSHYNLKKMFNLANNAIFGFSTFWINLVVFFSIVLFTLSLFVLFFLIFNSFNISEILTFVIAIALLIAFILQALFFGIAINYIFKIYDEIRNRPLYIISELIE